MRNKKEGLSALPKKNTKSLSILIFLLFIGLIFIVTSCSPAEDKNSSPAATTNKAGDATITGTPGDATALDATGTTTSDSTADTTGDGSTTDPNNPNNWQSTGVPYSFYKQTVIKAGNANCSDGGYQIDAGFDNNKNGILDDNEIVETNFVCNGSTGATGSAGKDLTVTECLLSKSNITALDITAPTVVTPAATIQLAGFGKSVKCNIDLSNQVTWSSSDNTAISVNSKGVVVTYTNYSSISKTTTVLGEVAETIKIVINPSYPMTETKIYNVSNALNWRYT